MCNVYLRELMKALFLKCLDLRIPFTLKTIKKTIQTSEYNKKETNSWNIENKVVVTSWEWDRMAEGHY